MHAVLPDLNQLVSIPTSRGVHREVTGEQEILHNPVVMWSFIIDTAIESLGTCYA